MDKKQQYIIPPKMSKATRFGGLDGKTIGILLAMFGFIVMIVVSSRNMRLLYLFTIPVVYGMMAYRIDDYSGADFFKAVIHYYWTPQTYVLTQKRKERESDG